MALFFVTDSTLICLSCVRSDLSLGDVHLIPIDDLMSRGEGQDLVGVFWVSCDPYQTWLPPILQLALVVAQSRGAGGRLSGINMSALTTGLQKIATIAFRRKGQLFVSYYYINKIDSMHI